MNRTFLLLILLTTIANSQQYTIRPMPANNQWRYSLMSLERSYYHTWHEQLTYDTLRMRPRQSFVDSIEGGRFVCKLDTVKGRGSTRRSWFSTFWIKDTVSRRDTFDLPNLNYGESDWYGNIKNPSDSLHYGSTHTFIYDTLATEQIVIVPLMITSNNAQVWIKVAHTEPVIMRYADSLRIQTNRPQAIPLMPTLFLQQKAAAREEFQRQRAKGIK